jgi:signal transduction histidine kinase
LREVEWAVTLPTEEQRTWLVSQAVPEALPDGRRYAVLIANDITARKQAEVALQTFNATLEQQVAARTAELERSNRELDQFAYIASHDLKAPLRAIDYLAAWIADDAQGTLPPTSQEHLTKLRARTKRLELLLTDLLTYARVGHSRQAGVRVDTAAVVRQQIEHLALPPGFTIHVPDGLPIFIGERVPLETVFRNLLGNSVKHHHQPETGMVQITAQDLGAWLAFTVSDNGPGIDPTHHTRIFEMFQTLKPRDDVEGSGLGLAFVKRAVEARGGTIQVESSIGQGTTFRFTWPKTLTPNPAAEM